MSGLELVSNNSFQGLILLFSLYRSLYSHFVYHVPRVSKLSETKTICSLLRLAQQLTGKYVRGVHSKDTFVAAVPCLVAVGLSVSTKVRSVKMAQIQRSS